jgi:hypothetical protein
MGEKRESERKQEEGGGGREEGGGGEGCKDRCVENWWLQAGRDGPKIRSATQEQWWNRQERTGRWCAALYTQTRQARILRLILYK